jgi:hypothetical protein
MQNGNGNKLLIDNAVVESLEGALGMAQAQLRDLERELEDLREKVRTARGTGDVTAEAEKAEEKETIQERILGVLSRGTFNLREIAKAVAAQQDSVLLEITKLHTDGKVSNLGSVGHPQWTRRIGDGTPTPVLIEEVRRLLRERPMTSRELADATGARYPRVEGALTSVRRGPDRIVNLSDEMESVGRGAGRPAGKWFILSERMKSASLPPKPST